MKSFRGLAFGMIGLAGLMLARGTSVSADDETGKATAADDKVKVKVETKEVKVKTLSLNVPVAWKTLPNSTSMRLATWELPAAEGDDVAAEMTIFNFPGGGGDVGQNLDRWVSQFASEGRTVEVRTGKAGDRSYVVSTVSGTYHKPVGPPIQRQTEDVAGYRMINVILNVGDGDVYFLKLVGPDATVKSHAKAFRATFGANLEEEEEFSF